MGFCMYFTISTAVVSKGFYLEEEGKKGDDKERRGIFRAGINCCNSVEVNRPTMFLSDSSSIFLWCSLILALRVLPKDAESRHLASFMNLALQVNPYHSSCQEGITSPLGHTPADVYTGKVTFLNKGLV